jgi:hypothetical protein
VFSEGGVNGGLTQRRKDAKNGDWWLGSGAEGTIRCRTNRSKGSDSVIVFRTRVLRLLVAARPVRRAGASARMGIAGNRTSLSEEQAVWLLAPRHPMALGHPPDRVPKAEGAAGHSLE